MKSKLLITLFLVAISATGFAQNILFDPTNFGKAVFEAVKAKNYDKIAALMPTQVDVDGIVKAYAESGLEENVDIEKSKKEFNDIRKELLAKNKSAFTELISEIEASGVVLKNATFKRIGFEIKGGKSFAYSDFIVKYDYSGVEYHFLIKSAFLSKRGWILGVLALPEPEIETEPEMEEFQEEEEEEE